MLHKSFLIKLQPQWSELNYKIAAFSWNVTRSLLKYLRCASINAAQDYTWLYLNLLKSTSKKAHPHLKTHKINSRIRQGTGETSTWLFACLWADFESRHECLHLWRSVTNLHKYYQDQLKTQCHVFFIFYQLISDYNHVLLWQMTGLLVYQTHF